MEALPDFAKGKFLEVEGKAKKNNLWEELGEMLNSERPKNPSLSGSG